MATSIAWALCGDNTSFILTAAAFDVDFERGRQFGIDLCMDPDRLYPDYKTMFEEEAKRPDGIKWINACADSADAGAVWVDVN